ncbi:diguanylate cyclase [Coraliomargarita sinensis]|uniref:Diguanylate cyclase n=2 Tax=Coraliomargarita sinensis TaxID=2174842 RepID=A0A317ZHS5_9BACT|nr:diguanylate cyclase [Coraliomargarita sinensis]
MVEGENDAVARMSTICCELYHAFTDFHWVGFYRLVDPQTLKVGPYQGGHGCLTITTDRGVCGACIRERKVQIENDVSKVKDHIACSPETKSEIVLPILDSSGALWAVLDIDSTELNAFDETDLQWLLHISKLAACCP